MQSAVFLLLKDAILYFKDFLRCKMDSMDPIGY